jgi:predicted RNase H-like nuclease (RuvC/YqgF family)
VFDQQVLTALLTAAGTIIAGLLAWIGARQQKVAEAGKTVAEAGRTAAETEKTVSEGFNMLVTKLQEERAQLTRVIDEQSEEITALRTEVRALTRQVVKLENVITKAGLEVPDARAN